MSAGDGCSPGTRERQQQEGGIMAKSGDIVKGLYSAFAAGDVPTVLAAFAPGIEWREADGFLYAEGNPYIGPQSIAEGVFKRLAGDIEEFRVIPEKMIDAGSSVVVEGRYTGRVKATGRPVDAQFAHVWDLDGGKVTRFQQYTDTWQWREAAKP
jgi:ketosteroid isomerase-like protein